MSRETKLGAPDWVSYDEIVESYERYHVDRGYALQARDIVLMLGLADGASVLDVGTGTGEAALAAVHCRAGVVIGLDPSLPMLRLAAKKGLNLTVAGEAPELPFRSEQFDAVIAALVITHLARCGNALREFLRVLKPGGKLGVTTWAGGWSEYARLWRSVAERFAGVAALQRTIDTYQPQSDSFADPVRVAGALQAAGFENIRSEQREYTVMITAAEYLLRMESSLVGRWMRHSLEPARWHDFRCTTAEQFERRFPDRFAILSRANFAIATTLSRRER